MSPEFYPISLNLTGRRCVVVGGGAVAARKVEGLLKSGGEVLVVAPEVTGALRKHIREGRATWRRGAFEGSDLDGAAIAFVATSDPSVNRGAAEEAKRRGIWVNAADGPGDSDFILPAVARRGLLCVAVSTGGASPALAAWVRDRLGPCLPEELGALAEVTRAIRKSELSDSGLASRRWREFFDSGILEDLARGDWKEADRKVSRSFGQAPSVSEILEKFDSEVR